MHDDTAPKLTREDITKFKELARSPKLEPVRMPDGSDYYYLGMPGFVHPSKAEALGMWENVRFLTDDEA